MTNRRDFLMIGLGAAFVPVAPPAAAAATPATQAATPIYKMIFDERFSAARAFAQEAATLGAKIHAIAGDVTDLWYNDLYHRWRDGPIAIAGMTPEMPLFCLENLARDAGLRLMFHSSFDGGDKDARLATRKMLRFPARDLVRQPALSHPDMASETLFSWIIAPVARG